MNKRILIVSWHFPPGKSSSGFNFFKRIRDSGYVFDVIYSGTNQIFGANSSMFYGSKSIFNLYRMDEKFTDPYDADNRKRFIESTMAIFEKLDNKYHYTALVSHSNEFISHIAAYEIKKNKPQLPWFASYGDPYGGNPYNEFYKRPSLEGDVILEKSIKQYYDGVIVTNEYQRRLMLEHFDDPSMEAKFHILPHCFVPEYFEDRKYVNDCFQFSHIGMLYKHKRTSQPFVEAVKYILNEWPQYADRFRINFIGADDIFIREFKGSPYGDVMTFTPAVSYRESIDLMCQADALLLRDADFTDNGISYSPFYPGKLADYLGANRPVIGVTMADGFVSDLFQDYGHFHCVTEGDTEGLARLFKDAIDHALPEPACCLNFTSIVSGQNFRKIIESSHSRKRILFAGHNLSFIQPLINYLQDSPDYEVSIDKWENHKGHNEERSLAILKDADIIFCEWGLGNAVWYSRHKEPGQKLIVRVHRQEIELNYLNQVNIDNIDNFIAVGPYYYEKFINKFNLPRKKTKIIYNVVDQILYNPFKEHFNNKHIGIIGYVPKRKRLDLAINLLESLLKYDNDYYLHIKGKNYMEYKWIQSNIEEKLYFSELFERIQTLSFKEHIIIEPYSNDISDFLSRMNFIISTSDDESFHMTIAEGMMAGCIPIIRNWPGADMLYPSEFIFSNIEEMKNFIISGSPKCDRRSIYEYPYKNFSTDMIIPQLLKLF